MNAQSLCWRRADQPGHEASRLSQVGDTWQLEGTAVFLHQRQPCLLSYVIACDAAWHTRAARVSGWLGGEPVGIDLAVDANRRWWYNGAEIAAVAGCIDLDLNFSPATNLLPIRRLALAVGAAADVRAAWLRFPSMRLEPLLQTYRRLAPDTYGYESDGGAFAAELRVDQAGFVANYLGLWEQER